MDMRNGGIFNGPGLGATMTAWNTPQAPAPSVDPCRSTCDTQCNCGLASGLWGRVKCATTGCKWPCMSKCQANGMLKPAASIATPAYVSNAYTAAAAQCRDQCSKSGCLTDTCKQTCYNTCYGKATTQRGAIPSFWPTRTSGAAASVVPALSTISRYVSGAVAPKQVTPFSPQATLPGSVSTAAPPSSKLPTTVKPIISGPISTPVRVGPIATPGAATEAGADGIATETLLIAGVVTLGLVGLYLKYGRK